MFIDKQAFADCPDLSAVSFPSTLQDIEDSFVNCSKLISADLSSASKLQCLIGSFKGCTSLTTVTLPENLEEIGESAFEGCTNLAHLKYGGVKPPIRFIGANAFRGSNVDRTPPLNKVEYLGPRAFYPCSTLKSITLPDSVQSIGGYALKCCSSLVELDVSKIALSVTDSINWSGVFNDMDDWEGCSRITKLICREEQADKMRSVFTNAILEIVS